MAGEIIWAGVLEVFNRREPSIKIWEELCGREKAEGHGCLIHVVKAMEK